ncbi:MAG: cell division protein ZapA [Deltaproteobacteria bacterium HGW-Deltaproteobacteria-19]|nr:MAG: cell division protein ZapA [Deltaproteobacteria bacterium HGW-Deltaproteobacteria-19]
MKNRFQIKILGQDFSVTSDDGEDHVTRVVALVNDRIGQIGIRSPKMPALHIAILAALNIADEYVKLEESSKDFSISLKERSEKLISLIDEVD